MNERQIRVYHAERRRGIPARGAFAIARAAAPSDGLDWKAGGVDLEVDGFHVIVKTQTDEFGISDFDFYGTLERDRSTGKVTYTPGYADYYDDARKDGMSKASAREYERASLARDRARLEDYGNGWCFIGIVATAYRAGVELGQASLWGIESDSDQSYLDETAREQADEAVTEAKAALARLCAA